MDRNRYKKIIWFSGLLFLVVLLLLAGGYLWLREQDKNQIAARLLLEYPQIEGDILTYREKEYPASFSEQELQEKVQDFKRYGYTMWNTRESRLFAVFFLLLLVLTAALFSLLSWLWNKRYQQELQGLQKKREQIEECLTEFLEENYEPELSWDWEDDAFLDTLELLKKLGFSFKQLKESLEAEEARTKALITDISHQLKTPLASLSLSYEMLNDSALSQEEQEEFFQQGKHELEKLRGLMELFLNISRLEGNIIHIKAEQRNLKETLLKAINAVIMKAVDKDIELSADFEDSMVKHDFRWTQEALINVLDNSIKYSAPNTKIKLSSRNLASYVLIEIEDEGIGIESQDFHKIFQRFYRGSRAKEMERDGAGVGLYLARQILEQQGGTICVKERRTNKGSCFQIMLPLEKKERIAKC